MRCAGGFVEFRQPFSPEFSCIDEANILVCEKNSLAISIEKLIRPEHSSALRAANSGFKCTPNTIAFPRSRPT